MWHSIPAAFIAAGIAFLVCSCDDLRLRLFKSFAVFVGFCSHLALDEVYSIDLSGRSVRVKKSLGTAMKFWSGNNWANFSTYAKLTAVFLVIAYDETLMQSLGFEPIRIPHTAREWFDSLVTRAKGLAQN